MGTRHSTRSPGPTAAASSFVALQTPPSTYSRPPLEWVAELGEFQHRLEEVIDLGHQVLLLGRMKGIGRGSGAEFDSEVAYLITLSAGRMVREQPFRSHEEALEAAGLSE